MANPMSIQFWVMQTKLMRIWEKESAEVSGALVGSLPRYLVTGKDRIVDKEIPVLAFHSVEPDTFEAQLIYLVENGYETLNAGGLLEAMGKGFKGSHRMVALTFDDATGSAWTVAYPLLKKYGLKAILFAIPGLVPAEEARSATLEEVWKGQAEAQEVLQRESLKPLCTWTELQEMEQSGIFDIQSHSMTHVRINVAPQVVDFLHPNYNAYFYGNVNIPVRSDEPDEYPRRELRLGQPVYASASRLSGRPRYLENSQISQELVGYVAERGGVSFFNRKNWRGELLDRYQTLKQEYPSQERYEKIETLEAALRREMGESRQILQEKLAKQVDHFCYPWYQGSTLSNIIAAECGYRVVYYGLEPGRSGKDKSTGLLKIRRISDEYLYCLPGKGSQSLGRVWARKVVKSFKRRRA